MKKLILYQFFIFYILNSNILAQNIDPDDFESFIDSFPVLTINSGHSGFINSVSISPNGKYAVSSDMDRSIILWEFSSGRKIRTFSGNSSNSNSLCFSPDSKYLLTGNDDQTLNLWDISNGEIIKTFRGHTDKVTSVCFSPDGKFILSGSWDRTMKLWDISSGNVIKTFKGHFHWISSVCFSPNGKYALSGSLDCTLKLWDISTGEEIKTFAGHSSSVYSVCFAPNSKYVLSGSEDKTVKLWDISTGKVLNTFLGHKYSVYSVCFSPNGKYALSGSDDNTLKLWDISSKILVKTFLGHRSRVFSVCFSPDGKYILSSSMDKTIKLWDVSSGKNFRNLNGNANSIRSVSISPNGKYIIAGNNKDLILWDLTSGKYIETFSDHKEDVTSVCFSSDCKYILSASEDCSIKLWNIESNTAIKTFSGKINDINSIRFSPDNKYVLYGGWGVYNLIIWEISTGRQIQTFAEQFLWIFAACFSPDGKYILSGTSDTIKLRDISTGLLLKTFSDNTGVVTSLNFSLDGKIILSGSNTGTLNLWNVSTGKVIFSFLGHNEAITCSCFSPDGRYILSGSIDKTIRLWDVLTGKEVRRFLDYSSIIKSVCFTPDGKYIISVSGNKAIKFWNISNGEELCSLSYFDKTNWVLTSPEGLYDGSAEGLKQLYYVKGMNLIPLDSLYNQNYIPGLFSQIISGKQFSPLLSVSNISFIDKNGNNRIDGNEDCSLNFTVTNNGKGVAKNLKVLVQNNSTINGLSFNKLTELGTLAPNSTQNFLIPINGSMYLTSGTASFRISFEESMGFPPDPFELNIDTKEFIKPDLKVVDNSFLTDNGSIKLGFPVQLKVLIQNVGQGIAENVNVNFQIPDKNVFPNGEKDFIIGNMVAGETKELIFEFVANKLYTGKTIPITIKITEKFGKYGHNKQVIAEIDSKSSGNSITITSNVNDNVVNIQVASLSSDVDINVPQNSIQYPNRYALIIGNEDYSSHQKGLNSEVNVDFAANDASIFKEYCIKTLGIPEKQIRFLINATTGQMNQGISWLNNLANIDNGGAELIFYYSGHGLPNEQTRESYLIPVDISGNDISQAIKLSDVYQKLTEFPVKRVTVFLDACFSGGARNQNLISLKGVKIKPKDNVLEGNIIVFSSSSGEESSGVYKDKKHGFMTYFLLKKMQESLGDFSYKELSDYIFENVRKESALLGKTQTPQLNYSKSIENNWENWKFK